MVLIFIMHFNYWKSLLSTRASLSEASWNILCFMRNQCLLWNTNQTIQYESHVTAHQISVNPILYLVITNAPGIILSAQSSIIPHSNWIQMSSASLWSLFLGKIIEMGKYHVLQHHLQAICALIGPMVNSPITVFIMYSSITIQALFTDPEEMCQGIFNPSAHSLPITHEQFFYDHNNQN